MLVETPLQGTIFVIFAYILGAVIALIIAGLMYLLSLIIRKSNGKETRLSQPSE